MCTTGGRDADDDDDGHGDDAGDDDNEGLGGSGDGDGGDDGGPWTVAVMRMAAALMVFVLTAMMRTLDAKMMLLMLMTMHGTWRRR